MAFSTTCVWPHPLELLVHLKFDVGMDAIFSSHISNSGLWNKISDTAENLFSIWTALAHL